MATDSSNSRPTQWALQSPEEKGKVPPLQWHPRKRLLARARWHQLIPIWGNPHSTKGKANSIQERGLFLGSPSGTNEKAAS